MMKPNAYLAKQAAQRVVLEAESCGTERQYMVDMMCLALNEMGFGRMRLKKLYKILGQKYDGYREAVTTEPEADYKREILDRELKRVMKEDFQPFERRYKFVREVRTGKGKA